MSAPSPRAKSRTDASCCCLPEVAPAPDPSARPVSEVGDASDSGAPAGADGPDTPVVSNTAALHGEARRAVEAVLEESRRLGFLGPGPIEAHIDHALACADVVASCLAAAHGEVRHGVDLGTGGGLPGLVLAACFPALRWTLLDSMARRTSAVTAALAQVASPVFASVSIVTARAEEWAAGEGSEAAELVVARSFGPPSIVAECAAPMLRIGGWLVVSEPPVPSGRWAGVTTAPLGLGPATLLRARDAWFARLRRVGPITTALPRRPAVMERRPWF